jgi:hypothetical protein
LGTGRALTAAASSSRQHLGARLVHPLLLPLAEIAAGSWSQVRHAPATVLGQRQLHDVVVPPSSPLKLCLQLLIWRPLLPRSKGKSAS